MTENPPALPVNKIAFIIDDEVVDIIYAHDRLAAVLLSDPLIVEVTGVKNDGNNDVNMGDTYNKKTKKFTVKVVGA